MPLDTKQDSVDAEIGERLHLWMWRNRVSQTELSERLEMTQSSLSRKLRGVSPWSAGEVMRVALALNVSVGWLYGEAGAVRPKGFEPLTFWFGVWRARLATVGLGRRRPAATRWCHSTHPVGDVVRSDDLALAS